VAAADGIKPDAALEAGAGTAAELTLHFVFGDQFAGTHRHVKKA
jgi:hypothetical protein